MVRFLTQPVVVLVTFVHMHRGQDFCPINRFSFCIYSLVSRVPDFVFIVLILGGGGGG